MDENRSESGSVQNIVDCSMFRGLSLPKFQGNRPTIFRVVSFFLNVKSDPYFHVGKALLPASADDGRDGWLGRGVLYS